MMNLLWIALGGGLGALARYGLSGLISTQPLPYNIFIINVSGSFLIAVVMTLSLEYGWLSERGRLFLSVGVLGGYTTFSTFMLGIYLLLSHHALIRAYTYTIGSLLFGLAFCWLGGVATRRAVEALIARKSPPEDPNPAHEGAMK